MIIDNILQSIPGCIYWKDINGVYLGCNQMEAELLGLNFPKEVVGKTDYDLLLKYAAEVIEKTDKRIMKTEISEEMIETGTFFDGRTVTLLTRKSPLYDDKNNVIGIIGVSVDITKLRKKEELENMLKTYSYINNILQHLPGCVYWKDVNGVYLGCNQMEAEIVGLKSCEEIVGKTDYDFSWKCIAEVLRETDQRIMKTKTPEELIETPIISDGRTLIMLTRKSPLYDDKNNVIGIIGVSVDITKLRKKEELENKLKTYSYINNILQHVPGCIYWKDVNGAYLGCNQMEAEILGLKSCEEIIGKTDYDLSWKHVADVLRNTDKRIMKSRISEELIESGTIADGRTLIMLTKKSPLYDDKNNVIGILGVSIDITDRKKAEELENELKLQESLYSLSKRVAHDIVSPLSSLKIVQFMSAGKLSKEEKNILDLSIKSIETMCKTLMDKYRYIKSKKDKAVDPPVLKDKEEYISLGISLESIMEVKKYEYKTHHKIKINYYPDKTNDICINGDESMFSRMMSNIINNAVEALENKDEGTIDVGYIVKQDKVEIYVKDNGKGMPKEMVEKIINCQEVATTKKTGHGLGLEQIMQTLQNMNAQILINSQENVGTEIKMVFNIVTKKDV
jgi:PAS domain S-box-containing protein